MRSASFSTDRCREMDAAVTGKCAEISPADIRPFFSRFSISRRIGSASARSVCCKLKVIPRPFCAIRLTVSLTVNHMIAQSPRPVKAGARLCRSPSNPARCFVPEHRFRAGAVRIIGMTVAAELFQGRDLPFRRPLDPGDAVKFFHSAVLHGVPEIPLHHGLPFFMEKLPDVPDQHPTAGVPLLEPVPDRLPPAILRAPALGVDHIFCKDLVDAQILLFEPHLEPQPDAAYPFFHVCVLLILMRSSSMP